jgi:hypothetical protein
VSFARQLYDQLARFCPPPGRATMPPRTHTETIRVVPACSPMPEILARAAMDSSSSTSKIWFKYRASRTSTRSLV